MVDVLKGKEVVEYEDAEVEPFTRNRKDLVACYH
jgi:hypothetical protein